MGLNEHCSWCKVLPGSVHGPAQVILQEMRPKKQSLDPASPAQCSFFSRNIHKTHSVSNNHSNCCHHHHQSHNTCLHSMKHPHPLLETSSGTSSPPHGTEEETEGQSADHHPSSALPASSTHRHPKSLHWEWRFTGASHSGPWDLGGGWPGLG